MYRIHTHLLPLIILLSCALTPSVTFAKKRDTTDVGMNRKPPKVILVMLFTETNRFDALVKAKRFQDTAILRKDMESVRTATVRDYTDNFKFCPVYFFNDVDVDAVKDKKFDGVLMNGKLGPAQNVNITDTNYLIIYYGFPGWQSHERRMEVTTMGDVGSKPNGWGMVLNNHEMKQVGYTYWLQNILSPKKKGRLYGYKYVSPKFDIEYFPLATEISDKLRRYAGKYAAKHPKGD